VQEDWFRKTSWSEQDQSDFRAHLARAQGRSRAQYLRIQAGTLSASQDLLQPAIELLDEMLSSYPDSEEVATALAQKADCLYRLGDIEAAVSNYAASVERMRKHPKMLSQDGWLNFALIVAKEGVSARYNDVLSVLLEFAASSPFLLPADLFKIHAAKALIAMDRGIIDQARNEAKQALEAADQHASGLPHHPAVGLVGAEQDGLVDRLKNIAA
jgi:tetratricopeptide (TPR) repeat protein